MGNEFSRVPKISIMDAFDRELNSEVNPTQVVANNGSDTSKQNKKKINFKASLLFNSV